MPEMPWMTTWRICYPILIFILMETSDFCFHIFLVGKYFVPGDKRINDPKLSDLDWPFAQLCKWYLVLNKRFLNWKNTTGIVVVPPTRLELVTPAFITLQLSLPSPRVGNVRALDFLLIIPTEVGLDSHRQVSTRFPFGTSLGIAILQVSPTLMSVHPKVSQWGRNIKLRMRCSTSWAKAALFF